MPISEGTVSYLGGVYPTKFRPSRAFRLRRSRRLMARKSRRDQIRRGNYRKVKS